MENPAGSNSVAAMRGPYPLKMGEPKEFLPKMAISSRGSRPPFSASADASPIASMIPRMRKFPISFARLACGGCPTG